MSEVKFSKPVPPFVRYCAANIPMVFDDSLSYYEALCALWKWLQTNLVDVINSNAAVTEYYIEYDKETRRLFNQLKNYVDTYFDNLDVQEEINNKLDAMVENGTFQQIVGTYLGIVTPYMFGAVSGTDDDQSEAISDCLEYAFEHGIKNVYLDGDFFVDTKITFTNKANITIKNGTIRVHETSAKLADGFKVFGFTNCSNINFENVRIIETEPEARTRNLYQGGIYFTGCTQCSVKGCYFENTYSGVVFKTGNTKCIAEDNEIYVDYQSAQFASSAILSYGSDYMIIKNNIITGEFYDGTLSIYGGSDHNIVDGNIIRGIFNDTPIWLSEGITVDAACDNTLVVNNDVSGQWYGIDNKNDSRNTLISNNTVRACKVAICDRPGEENKQTFNCQIKNNQIVIEHKWDTSSLATTLFEEIYYYIGIYSGQRLSADIKSNKINLYKSIEQKTVCGILCSASTNEAHVSNTYMSQFDVHDNSIEFATGFGSDASMAGSNSCGIYYKNVLKGSITGNSLKVDATANTYHMIRFAGDNTFVYVTNNNYLATSINNHYFAYLSDGATLTNSKVVANNLKNCMGRYNLGSFSNLVESPICNFPAHQMAAQDFAYDTYKTIGTITPQYGCLVRLKVECVRGAGGNKYIIGDYILSIGDSTVTLLDTVTETTSGITVQFVHGTNTRDCDIQVKFNSSVTGFDRIYVTDIMSEQHLVYS